VRIGVVDAVHGDLLDVGVKELTCERLGMLGLEAVRLGHPLSVDSLEDEYALGHVRLDHLRHDQVLEIAHETGDHCGAVGFFDEVELGGEMRLQLLRRGGQLQQARRLGASFGGRGQRAQQFQVERDLLRDSGAPHLDDGLPARSQESAVDLSDRGRCNRLLVEPGKEVEADVFVDHLLGRRERKGRHVVDEMRELVDVDIGQEIRARREELPELDEGRAQLLEALPEGARALPGRRPIAYNADLTQHAEQPAAPRDARDLQSATRAACPRSHPADFARAENARNARRLRASSRSERRRRTARPEAAAACMPRI